jgi:hypothetical protein
VDDAGSKNETEKTKLGNKFLPYSRKEAKPEALREWRVKSGDLR